MVSGWFIREGLIIAAAFRAFRTVPTTQQKKTSDLKSQAEQSVSMDEKNRDITKELKPDKGIPFTAISMDCGKAPHGAQSCGRVNCAVAYYVTHENERTPVQRSRTAYESTYSAWNLRSLFQFPTILQSKTIDAAVWFYPP